MFSVIVEFIRAVDFGLLFSELAPRIGINKCFKLWNKEWVALSGRSNMHVHRIDSHCLLLFFVPACVLNIYQLLLFNPYRLPVFSFHLFLHWVFSLGFGPIWFHNFTSYLIWPHLDPRSLGSAPCFLISPLFTLSFQPGVRPHLVSSLGFSCTNINTSC